MPYAVDISHWTEYNSGIITPEQFQLHYNRGVRKYIVSIAEQEIARRQIENIVANAPWATVEVYRYYYAINFLPAAKDDELFIASIRNNTYNVQMHYLDIEDTTVSQPLVAKIADLDLLIKFWEGKCPTGLYTSESIWISYMQNYSGFNYMPLWFALWNWVESLNVNFGGWTKGIMKQTMGDFSLDGVHCDTNYYEEIVVPPQPPPIHQQTPVIETFERNPDGSVAGMNISIK